MTLLFFLKPAVYAPSGAFDVHLPGPEEKKKLKRIKKIERKLEKDKPLEDDETAEMMQVYESRWKKYLKQLEERILLLFSEIL